MVPNTRNLLKKALVTVTTANALESHKGTGMNFHEGISPQGGLSTNYMGSRQFNAQDNLGLHSRAYLESTRQLPPRHHINHNFDQVMNIGPKRALLGQTEVPQFQTKSAVNEPILSKSLLARSQRYFIKAKSLRKTFFQLLIFFHEPKANPV